MFTGSRFRTGSQRALLVIAALLTSTLASQALEVSARQRAICTPDALKYCGSALSDEMQLAACMLRAKPRLSNACRAVVSTLQQQYAQSSD